MAAPSGLCHCPAYVFPHKYGKRCEEWLAEFREWMHQRSETDQPEEEEKDAPPTSD